jgi:hypothetical protein
MAVSIESEADEADELSDGTGRLGHGDEVVYSSELLEATGRLGHGVEEDSVVEASSLES